VTSTSDRQPPADGLTVDIGDIDSASGDVSVLLVGELDMHTAPGLATALLALGSAGPQPAGGPLGGTVEFDLSQLTFLDLAGMRGLTASRAALVARGWLVCSAHPKRQVGWLIDFADQHGWLPHDFLCGGAVPLAGIGEANLSQSGADRMRMRAALGESGVNLSARERFFGSVRADNSTVTVTVMGEIDADTVGRFRAAMETGLAAGLPSMVLDVGSIDYADVCVVPVLEDAARRLAAHGGTLLVRHAPAAVVRLFQAAGLDEAIEIEPDGPGSPFVQRIAGSAGVPMNRRVLDAALALVVTMAQAVIAGADGVSITLPRQGRLGTVAFSNDVVLQMDGDQYVTGQGPCLDAATQGQRFHIERLSDETRWPDFVPRARARGIECILSTPLVAAGRSLGALNIYSRQAGALAEHEGQWADKFAVESATVLSTALSHPADGAFSEAIADGLRSREAIAIGTGIVMQRDSVSAAQAFRTLRDGSWVSHLPVREICEALATEAEARGRQVGSDD